MKVPQFKPIADILGEENPKVIKALLIDVLAAADVSNV